MDYLTSREQGTAGGSPSATLLCLEKGQRRWDVCGGGHVRRSSCTVKKSYTWKNNCCIIVNMLRTDYGAGLTQLRYWHERAAKKKLCSLSLSSRDRCRFDLHFQNDDLKGFDSWSPLVMGVCCGHAQVFLVLSSSWFSFYAFRIGILSAKFGVVIFDFTISCEILGLFSDAQTETVQRCCGGFLSNTRRIAIDCISLTVSASVHRANTQESTWNTSTHMTRPLVSVFFFFIYLLCLAPLCRLWCIWTCAYPLLTSSSSYSWDKMNATVHWLYTEIWAHVIVQLPGRVEALRNIVFKWSPEKKKKKL